MPVGLGNLLFVNNLVGPQVGDQGTSCLGHSWSIALEMQFYVLSPPLVAAMARARPSLALALPLSLAAASLLLRAALVFTYTDAASSWVPADPALIDKLYTRCAPYLFGMAAAYLRPRPSAAELPYATAALAGDDAGIGGGGGGGGGGGSVVSAALAVALGIAFAGSGNAFVHRQPALLGLVLVLFARAAPAPPSRRSSLDAPRPRARRARALVPRLAAVRAPLLLGVPLPGAPTRPSIAPPHLATHLTARLPVPSQFNALMPLAHHFFSLRGVTGEAEAIGWYLIYFVLAVGGTFALALISYLLVEKPCMNLRPALSGGGVPCVGAWWARVRGHEPPPAPVATKPGWGTFSA